MRKKFKDTILLDIYMLLLLCAFFRVHYFFLFTGRIHMILPPHQSKIPLADGAADKKKFSCRGLPHMISVAEN